VYFNNLQKRWLTVLDDFLSPERFPSILPPKYFLCQGASFGIHLTFFLCGTGAWTQDPVLAWQALHHLSHPPALCSSGIFYRVLLLCLPRLQSSYLHLPCSWWQSFSTTTSFYWVSWGLWTFCLGWSWTSIVLISTSWVAWALCWLLQQFLFIAFLIYNSPTVTLKCTAQWILIYSQTCATMTNINFRTPITSSPPPPHIHK
jgi:hypothetical protein